MNKTNHSPGKTKLRPLALGALAALLCSCAATSVKKTWKAPDAQPPAGKIAVLAMDERDWLRKGFENRLVAQLAKTGSAAVTTFGQLSRPQIKQEKRAAANRLTAS